MTNQNTALREPEREPERLRPHSVTTKTEPLDTISTNSIKQTTSTITSSSSTSSRLDTERCSPSSPSSTRLQSHSPTTPLALYQRKNNRDHQLNETQVSPNNEQNYIGKEERPSTPDDDTMSNDVGEKLSNFSLHPKHLYSKENINLTGLNMTLNSNIHTATAPPLVPPLLSNISSHPTDLRPSSRGGPSTSSTPSLVNSGGNSSRDLTSGSGLPSPMSEPIPGPSGMGPVQQVPLVSFHIFFY